MLKIECSFTGTQYALHLLTLPDYFRGYFMREIFSDIRESLWRDFKDRIEENESLEESDFDFNEGQMTVKYIPTGNMIISKGFKKSSGNRTAKLKSLAGATHVFIEEFDEISQSDFNQLDDSLRTVKGNIQVVRIFNPPLTQRQKNKAQSILLAESWCKDDFTKSLTGSFNLLASEWCKIVSAEFNRIMAQGTAKERRRAIGQVSRGTFMKNHAFHPHSGTPISELIDKMLAEALERDVQKRSVCK